MIIGITGGSGTGKSEVGRFLSQKGFFTIDCDAVVHEFGTTEAYRNAVFHAFPDASRPDGTIDRKYLAAIVFSDTKALEKLNAVVLPLVAEEIKRRMAEAPAGAPILLDAPTLFESGLAACCDCTIGVIADRRTRIDRIKARDNLSEEQAKTRVDAQHSDDFYREHCTYILENNGNLSALGEQIAQLIQRIGVCL